MMDEDKMGTGTKVRQFIYSDSNDIFVSWNNFLDE